MAYVGRPAPQFQFDALVKDSFSGNGSTTAFTLTKSPASVNSLLVLVNNVVQEPATAFTLSDTTLTFTSAPPSGSSNIYACFWGGTLGITTAVKVNTSNVAAITGNLTPSSNVAFSLGQPASAWKELWLDGNSLHLGNTSISIGKTGEVEFMKTNKLGQPVTSVDVANTTLSSGDVLSFYSANTTGNVRFARGVAIGYANSKVPGANLDVKGNTFISGVTTASTFEPTGDTSAGDDAAIGYTAAEGLILTGQGSTNDVTIKNDADADVITIATGTTNVDVVGDLTAGTLNADGDTSVGDDAAIGYTAAEGLILTGQGSTNDVTIKNDADADVLTIPTGTTAAVFAGNLRMTKGGDIASASPLVIDTDGNYFDVTGTTNFAAMTVAAGNFFMLQFDGALTITHGSGIELPGAANLTTAAGDRLICYATAANTVEVMNVATEAASAAGADVQTFTSSGTWTKPSSGSLVMVELWGAGGSGGSGAAGGYNGAGGGGGAYARVFFAIGDAGSTETVTIGAGGAAISADDTNGITGGNSTFGSLLTSYGGGYGGSSMYGGGGGGGFLGAGGVHANSVVGGLGGDPGGGAGGVASASGNTYGAVPSGLWGGGGGGATDQGANNQTGGASSYGGGGGGGGDGGTSSTNPGGASVFGGGGGGGSHGSGAGGAGGVSTFGGNGSAGASNSTNASAGSQPGGGGGGTEVGNTGAGGDGQCTVTTF